MKRTNAQSCLKFGFTLVELLVVIAIIGILMSMILPAVQSARESGRKTQCQNNLHQLGVAMLSYETNFKTFPPGATATKVGQWGASWVAWTGRFAEEDAKFKQLRFDCPNAMHPKAGCNDAVLLNYLPGYMFCASSNLDRYKKVPDLWGGQERGYGTYAGISGAYPNPNDKRIAYITEFQGYLASNGVLYANSALKSALIRDGLSKTAAIGEQSDWLVAADGSPVDLRATGSYGSMMGANRASIPAATGEWVGGSYSRAYNLTTIRYSLNTKTEQPGMGVDLGPNTAIQSAHVSGAYVLLCDGSTQYLTEDLEHSIFVALAIRDDGNNSSLANW
jgi:prepilin-type N-terminal cleavage/methylation domain-containing protein